MVSIVCSQRREPAEGLLRPESCLAECAVTCLMLCGDAWAIGSTVGLHNSTCAQRDVLIPCLQTSMSSNDRSWEMRLGKRDYSAARD